MKDKFFLMHMMPIVRAHIAIFDENGNVKEQLSESREEDLKLYSEIIKKSRKDFPYIILIDTSVVVCVMWNETEKEFIVIGKTALYSEFENCNQDIFECPKDKYTSAIILIWNKLTGKMIGKGDLWTKNIVLDDSVSKFVTENIFEYQENGKLHNPYAQEQREHDSIRRGDIEGLKASINEVYPGEIGKLAENQVRSIKNVAIAVITCASRCAIEGGLNAEKAFSMADGYIMYIEEEMNDPVEIERVVREAEFNYAKNWAAYAGDNYGQILSKDREWTVSDRQMEVTNNAFFMHCLPVRRNMIVTDDVIESPQSIVIPEAANREISATVVLKKLLESL